jgi:hypothetical protein
MNRSCMNRSAFRVLQVGELIAFLFPLLIVLTGFATVSWAGVGL